LTGLKSSIIIDLSAALAVDKSINQSQIKRTNTKVKPLGFSAL